MFFEFQLYNFSAKPQQLERHLGENNIMGKAYESEFGKWLIPNMVLY